MSEATNLVNKATNDDEEIEPQERYSSSDVIAAAEELKFKQAQKKQVVEDRVQQGKISKKEAQKELKKAYHTLAQTYDKETLEKEYATSLENGLTTAKAAENLVTYGHNELTPPKHDPWWLRLLKSIFGGFFNILLWVGSILCFIAYGIDDNEKKDPTNVCFYIFIYFLYAHVHLIIFIKRTLTIKLKLTHIRTIHTIKYI